MDILRFEIIAPHLIFGLALSIYGGRFRKYCYSLGTHEILENVSIMNHLITNPIKNWQRINFCLFQKRFNPPYPGR